MSRMRTATLLAFGVIIIGAAAGYWFARAPMLEASSGVEQATAAAAVDRKIIYYRDPSGAPYWSAEPKKDASGRDYRPVFEDEEISFEPGGKKPHSASTRDVDARLRGLWTPVNALMPTAAGARKIQYYRNPMGLPDTSP